VSNDLQYPDWQEAVVDALTEYRLDEVPHKLRLAELAIMKRLKESRFLSVREHLAIGDALRLLDKLTPAAEAAAKNDETEGVA
jgi:hypothetical protein